ncbi:fused DSP-PTPase phosphatase/NAD kinase-like protein [Tautonia plasticadhaerens]|uniref:Tyrosine phosphatase family protein n=1 Tax=Tautonia plasticadhaerens TaxID=2527974 RepID=A0A518H1T2_9BACT|nr:tyrosine-protein phosphatase [Tautonia plasticadhaerens]QDV34797.1 Tyrosine phosphatase family protein [Tautonia plasticadhaerens]
MRIAMAAALAAIVAGATTWLTIEVKANRLVWDHFDEVTPGVLYRSGQLNPEQLAEAIESYRLKTVVSFLLPGPDVEAERRLVERLGAEFINLPMPGDGFGREEQFRQVLDAIDDPTRRPVLVHCARGTCRTGSIVALYRMERQGWMIDDVARELERQGYREGWICGYVYGMVDPWPSDAFPGVPPRADDRPTEPAPELGPLPGLSRADRTPEHGGTAR